jgi:hypothetical protein
LRSLAILLLASLAPSGCGGDKSTERPEAGSTCAPILPLSSDDDPGSGEVDCATLDSFDVSLIDDFETGAGTGWYTNNDRTALQVPAPDTDPVPGEAIPGGRCLGVPGRESRFALHILTGEMTDYGGNLGKNMRRVLDETPCPLKPCIDRPPSPPPRGPCGVGMGTPQQPPASPRCITGADASAWDGVVLWARKAPGSASTIRVHVSDRFTDDSNQACMCTSYTNQNDTSDGCDKFGSFKVLDGTFRPYLFPFDEMQQAGWGKPSTGIDKSGLFSIGVDYGRGAWDLWIDDIGFYRRKK